ncbi:MAG: hypothetical protein ACTSQP_05700 [Promethearchaeota archaeon]
MVKSEVAYNTFYDTFTDFKDTLTLILRRKNNSGYIRLLFEKKIFIRKNSNVGIEKNLFKIL